MADRYGNGTTRDQREPFRAKTGSGEHAGPGFGWALAGAAGVAAALLVAQRFDPAHRGRTRESTAANGWSDEPEVRSSLPIERPASELYRAWRDPATLPRILAFLADIRPAGEGRSEWRADGPLGQSQAWVMQITEDRPGELIRASSGGGLVTTCEIAFRAASGGRGTIATLRVQFDPPGGMLGDVAARFFKEVVPKELASKALHFFKSLVLTGEIPTTDRQPAARRDSR